MRRLSALIAVLAITTIFSTCAFASSTIIKVNPQDDTVCSKYGVDRETPDPNASPNTAGYCFYGTGDSVSKSYTVMTFDLSSLPNAEDIGSAQFSFNLLSSSCGYGTEIGCASLQHKGAEVLRVTDQPLGWVSVDVTSYLKADRAVGNTSSWVMNFVANGYGGCGMSFSSGEDTANAPRLTVTTTNSVVPEPSSAMALLGLTGMVGLAIRRRRA